MYEELRGNRGNVTAGARRAKANCFEQQMVDQSEKRRHAIATTGRVRIGAGAFWVIRKPIRET